MGRWRCAGMPPWADERSGGTGVVWARDRRVLVTPGARNDGAQASPTLLTENRLEASRRSHALRNPLPTTPRAADALVPTVSVGCRPGRSASSWWVVADDAERRTGGVRGDRGSETQTAKLWVMHRLRMGLPSSTGCVVGSAWDAGASRTAFPRRAWERDEVNAWAEGPGPAPAPHCPAKGGTGRSPGSFARQGKAFRIS